MPRILSKFFSKKDVQNPFKILQQERCPESFQISSARKMPRILSKFFSKKDAQKPFKILQQERCPESLQNSSARKMPRILSKFFSKKDALNPFKILQQERFAKAGVIFVSGAGSRPSPASIRPLIRRKQNRTNETEARACIRYKVKVRSASAHRRSTEVRRLFTFN